MLVASVSSLETLFKNRSWVTRHLFYKLPNLKQSTDFSIPFVELRISIPVTKRVHFPCGLVVRFPGSHPGGPGSTPDMGTKFFLMCVTSVSTLETLLNNRR
ncbi:hypothetical protein AVEN_137655-1 [Araneus ventricosus]|uniref:Uncharacterized protein n=1 Tax=Araneus ventricosus TaxID=182803 RepID=A0A4Y2RWD9_ARAVE|nr:hypothetical protein AVEN_137655-1 [Araneus ventricosus]